MIKKSILFFSCITSIFFAGCSATGPKFSGFEAPNVGNAKLYVYRPSMVKASAIDVSVGVSYDESIIKIGNLPNNGYLSAQIPANKEVEVWGQTESESSVKIQTKNGETYCVKVGMVFGIYRGRPVLNLIDNQICRDEIFDTRTEN